MISASPPEHYIVWLISQATGRRFPTVTFIADTDMVTMGWVALTSTDIPEVVIAECVGEELTNPRLVEERANLTLSRRDLRYIPIRRVVDNNEALKDLPFSEFRKQYRPPTIYYADIYSDGEALVSAEIDTAAFLGFGGRISLLMPNPSLERP